MKSGFGSNGRGLIVAVAFVFVGVGVVAAWAMGDPIALLIMVLLGVAMAIVLCGDFSRFVARAPGGFLLSAERDNRPVGDEPPVQRGQ